MQRQRVKEQLGALEEQLELLGPLARAETFDTFQELNDLIHSDTLRKSVDAGDFLTRVSSILVKEAGSQGYELAVSHFGQGRISAEMAEVSMGAIIACLKASLRSYRSMGKAVRMQKNLFRTFSIYLEVRATADEIHFRLIDDGKGYEGGFIAELDADAQFQKLRSQVAAHGGWFSKQSFAASGGLIEFKVPLPRARFECLVLREKHFELLLPRSYCGQVVDIQAEGDIPCRDSDTVALMDEIEGLHLPDEGAKISPRFAVQVCVADFQFWILCEGVDQGIRSRRYPCADFLEDNAWFQQLGLFPVKGVLKALPLLEGENLMRFYAEWEAAYASV